jgi:hypothetical protein
VIEVDGSAITPELLLEFFATDQLAWLLQQSGQDPARLLAEPDARTVPEELAGLRIQLEWAKAVNAGARIRWMHRHRVLGRSVTRR